MKFGLALPHYDTSLGGAPASWSGIADIARLAERAGFYSVWISDHLFLDWGKYGGASDAQGSFECWTTMSALAAVTDSVRIGSLTLCNDLRNPALVAKMAASLDLLSDGRLDLAIGAGWYEPEYVAGGISFDSAGTRIRRLGEAVEIIGRLLSGEELTFKGSHYTIDGAVCRPRPAQRPRPAIWMGGKGDLLLSTAAGVADGWNFSWIGDIDAYLERAAHADRACERAARDPRTLRRSVGAYVVAGRDDRDLSRRFERLIERSPHGILSAVSLEEFRRKGVVGTTAEVTDALGRLDEAGVEEVIASAGALPFQVADADDVEFIGAEVVPALRSGG
jgi:alkanesulfonate monooxygenase SsuD/methylene tetrahydromethanopterin reductase-like flavin-dependent oxidoreductase (luciferase family)